MEVDQNGRPIVGRGTLGQPEVEDVPLMRPVFDVGPGRFGAIRAGIDAASALLLPLLAELTKLRQELACFLHGKDAVFVGIGLWEPVEQHLETFVGFRRGRRGVGPVLGGDGGGDIE